MHARLAKVQAGLAILATLAIVIYYWRFTHVSLRTGFNQDDLMNLFFAWRSPFTEIVKANLLFHTEVTRPFGALFYSSFFHIFGFEAFPFRVFCYAILWCNVLLTYLFVQRVTNSREIATLAVFLHCYQANYFPMYYGSGYCYDVFAFFFYYSAFSLYLNGGHYTLVAVLYACAMNSKEPGTTLPAMLLIYELLHRRLGSLSWLWRDGRTILVTGCVGVLYLLARFTGPNNLLNHPAYSPVFTLHRYLESTAAYLNELSAQERMWTVESAAVLLLSMACVMLLTRSRDLCFSWLLVVIGSAPVAFVQPRGVAAYYIPLVGYAMFAGIVLVRTREFLVRNRPVAVAMLSQAVLFAAVFALVWRWQIHNQRRFPDYWKDLAAIEATAAQFRSHPEWFRPGGNVLIVNDPFPEYEWASSFIAILIANDRSVNIHSLVKLNPKPTKQQMTEYTTILAFENGRFIEARL
jgi:hypothetical protein